MSMGMGNPMWNYPRSALMERLWNMTSIWNSFLWIPRKVYRTKTGYFVTVDDAMITIGTCFGEGGRMDPLTISSSL